MISECEFDEEGVLILCSIEAVMTKRSSLIDWNELKNNELWLQGWT